jgi:hypothetical protein
MEMAAVQQTAQIRLLAVLMMGLMMGVCMAKRPTRHWRTMETKLMVCMACMVERVEALQQKKGG